MKSPLAKFFRFLSVAAVALTMGCNSGDGDSASGEAGLNVNIPGVQGPTLTYSTTELRITTVFESLNIEGGLRYNIPNYGNSYLELGPDFQSSGTLMVIYLDLDDLADVDGRLRALPPQTLPGGRPLPGVRSGRLPAVAFTVDQFNGMTFYLGNNFYGLFIPMNLGVESAILTYRFHSGGRRAGNISLVGEDASGENSGILLLLDLNAGTRPSVSMAMDNALTE